MKSTRRLESPKEIPGCIELDPLDELSEYFSSAPPKRLHIIVEDLHTHERSRCPIILPNCPTDAHCTIFHVGSSATSPLYGFSSPFITMSSALLIVLRLLS